MPVSLPVRDEGRRRGPEESVDGVLDSKWQPAKQKQDSVEQAPAASPVVNDVQLPVAVIERLVALVVPERLPALAQ